VVEVVAVAVVVVEELASDLNSHCQLVNGDGALFEAPSWSAQIAVVCSESRSFPRQTIC